VDNDEQPPPAMGQGAEDRKAVFAAIVQANQAWVRGYFRARLRDWASADDLAQDVFVTAYLKLRQFRGDASVASWLHGIAHNHLRNFIRKHREAAIGGSEELQALLDDSLKQGESGSEMPARFDALAECLQGLPKQARVLLEQRYVEGRSVGEIAEDAGKGYSALTMQLHRLRGMLADCISREMRRKAL